jgi:heme-degrading monooxygenase HmoA
VANKQMISRHWTGLAKPEDADAYVEHLQRDTFPAIRRLSGFVAASILRRTVAEGVEFLIVTNWESLDAIRAFAGDDVDVAVVPDTVRAMMVRYDRTVRHFEVVE